MRPLVIEPRSCFKAEICLPADKSIAHRSAIISAVTDGVTRIKNFPANKDCLFTISALKKLGVKIKRDIPADRKQLSASAITVFGKGLYGFKKPKGPIFVGDSGTSLRLLLGILAGQDFQTVLKAGESLSSRPMLRVTAPLRLMGADIKAKLKRQGAKIEEYPPIMVKGGYLRSINYIIPEASAQVKSAILLASLYAKGRTCLTEPLKTRDHTERMLRLFQADLKVSKNNIVINSSKELASPGLITLPGDISSAAFFMVLAAIAAQSRLLIKGVSLNPSRSGIIRVLKRMGASIDIQYQRPDTKDREPIGEITIKSSSLKGTTIKRQEVPFLIDELPILMVAACFAQGKSVLEGLNELRLKETDRIKSMFSNLKEMGADILLVKAGTLENMVIYGRGKLKGSRVKSFGDHRTAMSMVIAGLLAEGPTAIDDVSCISKSFPDFLSRLNALWM